MTNDPVVDDLQVMHVLLVRGPLELQLPHKHLGVSVKGYCQWLDQLVAGATASSSPSAPSTSPMMSLSSTSSAGAAGGDASSAAAAGAIDVDMAVAALHASPSAYASAESAVWAQIRSCCDTYVQRLSTASGAAAPAALAGGSGSGAAFAEEYTWIVNNGPKLVTAYKSHIAAVV